MRYRVNSAWPVHGGSAIIPGMTEIDDSINTLLVGVVPPLDCTPLDEATREFLVRTYPGHVIAPVPSATTTEEHESNNKQTRKTKSK
jgi:hypothetical protein